MNDLMRVHRLLCLPFVEEAAYRAALGGTRADLGTVGRYLALPPRRRPVLSPYFDPIFYLATNPELMQDGADPLLHFLDVGFAAARSPHPLIDLPWLLEQDAALFGTPPAIEKLVDLLEHDRRPPGPYFDIDFYREQLRGEAPAQGLLRSFVLKGVWAGLRPNRLLDPAWYAERNLDAPRDPYGAMRHFIVGVDAEGRSPGPDFDARDYWRRRPDIAASRTPPLRHYLIRGRLEERARPAPEPVAAPVAAAGGRLPAQDRDTLLRDDAMIRDLLARRQQARKDAVRVAPPTLFVCDDPAEELKFLAFDAAAKPHVSILIPVFNEIGITV